MSYYYLKLKKKALTIKSPLSIKSPSVYNYQLVFYYYYLAFTSWKLGMQSLSNEIENVSPSFHCISINEDVTILLSMSL